MSKVLKIWLAAFATSSRSIVPRSSLRPRRPRRCRASAAPAAKENSSHAKAAMARIGCAEVFCGLMDSQAGGHVFIASDINLPSCNFQLDSTGGRRQGFIVPWFGQTLAWLKLLPDMSVEFEVTSANPI